MWHRGAAGAYPAAAAVIAPGRDPGRAGRGRAGLVLPDPLHGDGQPAGSSPAAAAAFDARQWRHQARSARARIAAPGSVPLSPGTGTSWRRRRDPRGRSPGAAACHHPVPADAVASGGDRDHRDRQDHAAAAVVGRLHGHRAAAARGGRRAVRRCWWCWTARAAPTRGGSPTGPAGCCAARAPRPPPIWPDEASLSLWALPPAAADHHAGGPDRARHRRRRLLRRRDGGGRRAGRGGAVRAAGQRADFLARLDPGWLTLAYVGPAARRRSWRWSARRPGRSATSRCGSAPCSAGWAAGWTGRAVSATPTPGTASWRAPAEVGVAEARPGRWSICWPATRRPARSPAAAGRSCWPWTSSARCPGGCPSGSCTSAPARSAWPYRYPRSPGRAWPPTRTSGTGSPRPPTAASGCCARRTPSRWPRWRAACKVVDTTRRLLGVPLLEPSGHLQDAAGTGGRPGPDPRASTSARPPTSTAAASPTSRSSGWSPRPPRWRQPRGRPTPSAGAPAGTGATGAARPHVPAAGPATPAPAGRWRRCWTRHSGRTGRPGRRPPPTRSRSWAWRLAARPHRRRRPRRVAADRRRHAPGPGGRRRSAARSPSPPLPTRRCGPGSAAARPSPTLRRHPPPAAGPAGGFPFRPGFPASAREAPGAGRPGSARAVPGGWRCASWPRWRSVPRPSRSPDPTRPRRPWSPGPPPGWPAPPAAISPRRAADQVISRSRACPATGTPSCSTSQMRAGSASSSGVERVAVDDQQVGELALLDRADVLVETQRLRRACWSRRPGPRAGSARGRHPLDLQPGPQRCHVAAQRDLDAGVHARPRIEAVPCSRL